MTTNLFNDNSDHLNSIKEAISIVESTWEEIQRFGSKPKLPPFSHSTSTTDLDTASNKSKLHFAWKGHIREYNGRNHNWEWSHDNIWGGSGTLTKMPDGRTKYTQTTPNSIALTHHKIGYTSIGNDRHYNFGVTHEIPLSNVHVTYPAHFIARINDSEMDGGQLKNDNSSRKLGSVAQLKGMIESIHRTIKTRTPEHNDFFLHNETTNTYLPTTLTKSGGIYKYRVNSIWPNKSKSDTRPVIKLE